MCINLAIKIKPQSTQEGAEWAAHIRASQLPCSVSTERQGHDSIEHHLVYRSASLKILQHDHAVEGFTIHDASPGQIAIVNILMTAGLL